MANIKNTKEWVDNVRQIEVGDRVIGGTDAPINICLSQLVGRTGYLKDKIDAVPTDSVAGLLKISSVTNSTDEDTAASLKAVKAAYDKAEESAGKGLPVGAVMGFPRAITSQEGFLKADGSTFAQATYPDLYRVLGSNKLPNLTRSDIGMTAYFPFGDIPDGWIKYDEIAVKVTQSAYPELYRKLVAQYGSIANVKPVDDYFVRNVGSSGQIGQQYPWAVGDHHHVLGLVAYGNDDLNLRRLPVDKYYPNQIKAGEPMFTIFGQLDGGEGRNHGTDMFSAVHEQAAQGKYSQKHAIPLTFDHAYTDQYTPKPYHQDNTPKYIGMVLCIKAKDSLDDVVMWIKAFGKVTNAGALDASTLAVQLQDKADKNHTHRAADISDLGEAVHRRGLQQLVGMQLVFAQGAGNRALGQGQHLARFLIHAGGVDFAVGAQHLHRTGDRHQPFAVSPHRLHQHGRNQLRLVQA